MDGVVTTPVTGGGRAVGESDERIQFAVEIVRKAESFVRPALQLTFIDAKQTFNLGLPITFSTGLKSRLTAYDLWKTGSLTWTLTGRALAYGCWYWKERSSLEGSSASCAESGCLR